MSRGSHRVAYYGMQDTSERSRRPRSRAALAGYLAVGAIGLDAVLLFMSGGPGASLGLPLAIIGSAMWVAAVLLLSPFRDSTSNWLGAKNARRLAALAALAHTVAFVLPAAYGSLALDGPATQIPGYYAFAIGYLVVPLAWLANPVFIVAFALLRQTRARPAAILAALATVLAASTWPALSSLPLGPGFVLWAASPALLTLAALFELRADPPVTPTVASIP